MNFLPALFQFSLLGFIKLSGEEPAKTAISDVVTSEKQQPKATLQHVAALIKQSDELFSVGKFQDSYNVLADLKVGRSTLFTFRLTSSF